MRYEELIKRIMPLINSDDSALPFIVSRSDGEWELDYPYASPDRVSQFLDELREKDPCVVQFTGADFAQGRFPYVYDSVLTARLRAEYDTTASDALNPDELHALVNFLEENMGELSSELTEYISQLDKPLTQLSRMIPSGLSISYPGEHYDTDTAWQALEIIEDRIALILSRREKDEVAAPAKRIIEGYEERYCILFAGKEIVIAENPANEKPYLICNIRYDNSLGMGESYDGVVSDDYVEIMREFTKRIDGMASQLEAERRMSGLPIQVMTTKDCLPDSRNMNWEGKLLIIKPEALAPEYRDARSQYVFCASGFGASPDSRGSKVYVKELHSGKECCYRRHQIAGIADPSKMPAWAAKKLAEQTQEQLGTQPPVKQLLSAKKPSLHEKLEKAKQTAQNAASNRDNGADKAKKRNDKEV